MKAASILEGAAAMLISNPDKWGIGDYAEDVNGIEVSPNSREAVRFCMMGAMAKYARLDPKDKRLDPAINVLYDYLKGQGHPFIGGFNDADGRTLGEVTDALRGAASLARERKL